MGSPSFEVFIDGGGNDCAWVKRYLGGLGPFQRVYVFEPNPVFHGSYESSDMILVKKAMWVRDCRMPLYVSKDPRQVASSLLQEKLCKVDSQLLPHFHDEPVEVECLDFSKWLDENVQPDHNVTLKLDIEGAEYEVLWKMIRDDTIRHVKKLLVEFHADTVKSKQAEHPQLIRELEARGLPPLHWD